MSKQTLLEMLNEMRDPDENILENKDNYTFSKSGKTVKLMNNKTGKNKVLKNDEASNFQSQLDSFQKKMKGPNGTFDKFVVTYGYDELLESEDYKYKKPSKDNKENEMSKTSKKEALKAAQKPKDSKADDASEEDNADELDEATRYQRELAEKDNPFEKKDKSDDDDSGDGKDDKSDKPNPFAKKGKDDDKSDDDKDDGKLTTDDDEEDEEDDKSEKSDDDDDDDEEDMKESVSLEDIVNEEVDAVKIELSEIIESLGNEDETLTEEDKVLFLKMGKLMEAHLKAGIKATGDRMTVAMEETNVQFQEWLTEKMDSYTTKVIKEWKTENYVAIQANAKSTLNENVVKQLVTVLEDNNINISDDDLAKVDAMNVTLSERDATISEISDEILESSQEVETLKKALIRKDYIIEDTDKRDIFDSLLEDVDYTNDADYANRLTVLYNKYIVEGKTVDKTDAENDVDVLSMVEDIHMFEDIDIDVTGLLDEAKDKDVQHPSGRVTTLLESLKRT